MSGPTVRLHDVSIDGEIADRAAVLAAIESAVGTATLEGSSYAEAVRSAVTSLATAGRGPAGADAPDAPRRHLLT
jgi:hypothetical protein